jgi:hypothetical protein
MTSFCCARGSGSPVEELNFFINVASVGREVNLVGLGYADFIHMERWCSKTLSTNERTEILM